MAEAVLWKDNADIVDYTPDAAVTGGEVVQLRDGRAAVIPVDVASGAKGAAETEGIYTVAKTTSIVFLDGGKVYWDHSANKAHFKPVNDRDFYLGTAVGDATSAATTMKVALNLQPTYIFDSTRDLVDTTIVKTVVGSTTVEVPNVANLAGAIKMTLGTTAEAQKVDAMSKRGFAVGSNAIAEFIINIVTNSDNAAGDLNFGLASGTHATDFDAIAECLAIHVDGASTNINAQSDDGSTAVAAADSTLDFTAGTPFEVWMDTRDPANCKIYVDGVRIMDGTTGASKTFILATGPFYWIAHIEKTSDDSPGTVLVQGGVRLAQQ